MKDSEIYRRAAERSFLRGDGYASYLPKASKRLDREMRLAICHDDHTDIPSGRDGWCMAFCLMAAIAESEGR